jgi:hypothetical protein
MRSTAMILAVGAALVVATAARAYERPAKLNEVAAVYSLGVGEIRCPSQEEWDADFGSSFGYAYTNMRDDYAVLSPLVCAGALGVGSDETEDWQEALGVLVLVHEAFHLRHWRWRRNEGKVECQAMVYFKEAAQGLGARPDQAHSLYAYAVALHAYKVSLFPQYRDRKCRLPAWAPPASAHASSRSQHRPGERHAPPDREQPALRHLQWSEDAELHARGP